MRITNNHGVPDVIWRAASNDKYSRGLADISVTQLIDAPQISILRDLYKEDLEQDVADRMWSLLGTAVHSLLEHAAEDSITEERLFTKAAGLTISGAIDVQEEYDGGIAIMDFKVTSVTSVMYGKDSWHNQLNCYALLVRRNKARDVKRLQICAILRDWKRSDMVRDYRYPRSPIVVVEIPVWPVEKQEKYFEERAELHRRAREGEDIPCAPYERWERGERWGVFKTEKSKRAVKNFDSPEEALQFAQDKGYNIIHKPGTCARCEGDYCGVARWCKQFIKPEPESDDGWL